MLALDKKKINYSNSLMKRFFMKSIFLRLISVSSLVAIFTLNAVQNYKTVDINKKEYILTTSNWRDVLEIYKEKYPNFFTDVENFIHFQSDGELVEEHLLTALKYPISLEHFHVLNSFACLLKTIYTDYSEYHLLVKSLLKTIEPSDYTKYYFQYEDSWTKEDLSRPYGRTDFDLLKLKKAILNMIADNWNDVTEEFCKSLLVAIKKKEEFYLPYRKEKEDYYELIKQINGLLFKE